MICPDCKKKIIYMGAIQRKDGSYHFFNIHWGRRKVFEKVFKDKIKFIVKPNDFLSTVLEYMHLRAQELTKDKWIPYTFHGWAEIVIKMSNSKAKFMIQERRCFNAPTMMNCEPQDKRLTGKIGIFDFDEEIACHYVFDVPKRFRDKIPNQFNTTKMYKKTLGLSEVTQ